MLANSQEDVAIFKGTAYVEGNGSRTKVRAGEHIALEEGHSELLPLNPADNWELWNMERDRDQSRAARLDSNLPDELRSHSAELDTNGTWVHVPEYGMVWRPTVIFSDDWAPYRSGRWIWKGNDYVWISNENWGWVPYHYGRWTVVSGFGWCWVPPVRGDVYWGPGYVGWYRTGSYVGWTPLAPGEIFYGRRYYGRQSVNITNVNVNTSTVIYRNQQVRGGVTVVQQNDFLRGRQPSGNISIAVSATVGSPLIQPLRETRMPIIKQTPPRVAPPDIAHRDNRELRDRFPRLIQESGSDRRRQQSAPPVSTTPVAPSNQTPSFREKRTVLPVIQPNETKPDSGTRSHDTPSKRDEYRQRSSDPQTVSQPVPAANNIAPQLSERPKRGNTPVTSPSPHETIPQRGEREPSELKQKKVWKVITPEKASDREKEHKDKERK
jgi:hypothetical protein